MVHIFTGDVLFRLHIIRTCIIYYKVCISQLLTTKQFYKSKTLNVEVYSSYKLMLTVGWLVLTLWWKHNDFYTRCDIEGYGWRRVYLLFV